MTCVVLVCTFALFAVLCFTCTCVCRCGLSCFSAFSAYLCRLLVLVRGSGVRQMLCCGVFSVRLDYSSCLIFQRVHLCLELTQSLWHKLRVSSPTRCTVTARFGALVDSRLTQHYTHRSEAYAIDIYAPSLRTSCVRYIELVTIAYLYRGTVSHALAQHNKHTEQVFLPLLVSQ